MWSLSINAYWVQRGKCCGDKASPDLFSSEISTTHTNASCCYLRFWVFMFLESIAWWKKNASSNYKQTISCFCVHWRKVLQSNIDTTCSLSWNSHGFPIIPSTTTFKHTGENLTIHYKTYTAFNSCDFNFLKWVCSQRKCLENIQRNQVWEKRVHHKCLLCGSNRKLYVSWI